MRTRFFYLLILLLLVISVNTQAQEVTVKRSAVVENYKGKPYYIHFVSAGETLTSIAKAYNVTIEEIAAENPAIDKGLKADMVIRIPQKAVSETPIPEVKPLGKKTDVVPKADSSDFILYLVKKQETLYGISKQFNSTVEDILNSNPGLDVLKDGMEIKIPKTKSIDKTIKNELSNEKVTKPDANPDEIVVKTGETLYSISTAHNLTVDELIDLNPQLSSGLKAGMIIKLRKSVIESGSKPAIIADTANAYKPAYPGSCYSIDNLKATYNIALLLPFALDNAPAALDASAENDPSAFESFNYIQFYAGFMMAADSLEKYGLKAKIQVLDADKLNDTLTIRQILRKPGMDKMDLLVGPMYASSFTIAARFAKKHEIGIVNPLSRRENITERNPFVIKAQVSEAGISATLISFICKNYPGSNIVAVRNDNKEFKALADDFNSHLKTEITGDVFSGTLQQSVFANDQISDVTKKLKSGVKNIVIMFSNSKTAVPNFVSLLNQSAKSHDIILVGMDGWDELELETEFLVNLNYHQVASNYLDFESEAVQKFTNSFKAKYGAIPLASKHAFLGYDIGWYFLTSLMKYGNNYLSCMPGNSGTGLQYNFNLASAKPGDGLQNTDVAILKLQNYKMVLVE